jgi:DNA polymerase III subunit chi
MTEVLFYHLQRQPIDKVLPALIEKSLERGWRVVVQSSSEERIDAVDAFLWTFRDDSFLPHGKHKDGNASEQPVLLTSSEENSNGAVIRFLLDGVPMPQDAASYQRVVVVFDGEDPEALAAARSCWRDSKDRGFEATYWQLDAQGRWQKKEST